MDKHNNSQGAGPKRITGPSEKTDGGIYYAKGPEFYQKFMAQYIMPMRRECAQMFTASMIQSGEYLEWTPSKMTDLAWQLADQLCLSERVTLDSVMTAY